AMSKPPTILEKIYAQRAQDVELAKKTPGTTPGDIAKLLSMHLAPPLIPFVDRLRRNPSNILSGSNEILSPSLMAEIKRASPSKGPIALTTPVAEQALTYALAGASVISVLTEPHWFKGSLHDMSMVRQSISSVPDRPAVLRKEFVLDEYQIAEARLYGADTVLLIVAMMDDELLTRLYKYSRSLGMEPLVEVNNAGEMRRALDLGAKVIGVNNRNLHDFNVDMGTTSRLVDMVKDRDVILCALSGISTPQDVRTYKGEGVKAVLVGESLMRAKDTAAFIRELLDWPDLRHSEPQRNPVVKVSGVTTPGEAQKLAGAGVSILGLVFDPTLANSITLDQAKAIRNVVPRSTLNPTSNPSQQTNVPWFHSHLSAILLQCTGQRPILAGHFTTHPSHTLTFILEVIATLSLDLVQFDGPIPADWARFIPVPVIRRF
ncbi:IGPS-domain-containing protein, partial [Macrolepiota fuliginosa MF-IS2]